MKQENEKSSIIKRLKTLKHINVPKTKQVSDKFTDKIKQNIDNGSDEALNGKQSDEKPVQPLVKTRLRMSSSSYASISPSSPARLMNACFPSSEISGF